MMESVAKSKIVASSNHQLQFIRIWLRGRFSPEAYIAWSLTLASMGGQAISFLFLFVLNFSTVLYFHAEHSATAAKEQRVRSHGSRFCI